MIYKGKFIIHLIEDVPTDVEKLNFKTYQANRKKDEKNTVAICPKSGGNIILKKTFMAVQIIPLVNSLCLIISAIKN